MKLSSYFKYMALLSFIAFSSAALAGGKCCPGSKEGKEGKDKETESVSS
jgi:hypothetical protein